MVINNKIVMYVHGNEVNFETEFKRKHIQMQLLRKNRYVQKMLKGKITINIINVKTVIPGKMGELHLTMCRKTSYYAVNPFHIKKISCKVITIIEALNYIGNTLQQLVIEKSSY